MSVRVGDYNQPLHKRIRINSFEKPDELDPKENDKAFACGRRPLFIKLMKSQKPSMKSIVEDYEYGSRYGNKMMNVRVRPIEEMRKADASYRKTEELYKDYVNVVANRRNQVFDTFAESYDDLPNEIGLQDKKMKEDIAMLDKMIKKLNLPKDVKAYLRNRNVGDILEPYLKGSVILPQDENNQDLNPMMALVQAITSQTNQAPKAPAVPVVSQASSSSNIRQAPSSRAVIPQGDLLSQIKQGTQLKKTPPTQSTPQRAQSSPSFLTLSPEQQQQIQMRRLVVKPEEDDFDEEDEKTQRRPREDLPTEVRPRLTQPQLLNMNKKNIGDYLLYEIKELAKANGIGGIYKWNKNDMTDGFIAKVFADNGIPIGEKQKQTR